MENTRRGLPWLGRSIGRRRNTSLGRSRSGQQKPECRRSDAGRFRYAPGHRVAEFPRPNDTNVGHLGFGSPRIGQGLGDFDEIHALGGELIPGFGDGPDKSSLFSKGYRAQLQSVSVNGLVDDTIESPVFNGLHRFCPRGIQSPEIL